VRILKNHFFEEVQFAEERGTTEEELKQLLGKGRARKGMFLGELEEGELEIGQSSALIKNIVPAALVVKSTWEDFLQALQHPL
jgi:enoyl-[acyl-carrier protein] reductase II